MKKRLLIMFSILFVVVLLVILNSTVFTVHNAELYYYDESGALALVPSSLATAKEDLISSAKGKNIFLLSEKQLVEDIHLNSAYAGYYVVGVVRRFPNTVQIHIAERIPVFYVQKDNNGYAVDINGYVVKQVASSSGYIDLTSQSQYLTSVVVGNTISWTSGWAQRFDYMCECVATVWRFKFDYADINDVIQQFSFDTDYLSITTSTGAIIKIQAPEQELQAKFEKAYSVYVNPDKSVQGIGNIITVNERGRVITTKE